MIAEWYEGRSVMVTGGTGFMGKVLLEKLLRSCPRLDTLYVLIRPKRGLQVTDRLQQLLSLSIFDEVRRSEGRLLEKVVAVEADISLPDLGLAPADQALLRQTVSVIFHSAATVKFDEPLKEAVAINLTATRSLLQFALTMSKLEAMVHVSTAYCNCDREEVSEQVYPTGKDPDRLIQAVEALEPEILKELTPRLLGKRPNTYTLTKALAEQVVYEQSGVLPIAIVRPSIVVAAWREPVPGWVDNLNGPTGMLVGAGKGVLRTFLCERDNIADLVPVDLAINFCIAAAWHTAKTRPNNIVVYNCTTGARNPIKWGELERWGHENLLKYPPGDVVWYPNGSLKRHRLVNLLAGLLFQRLPAHLLDLLARLTGNKPVMVKVQDKLSKASKTLEFFTMREFRFSSENVAGVWAELSAQDRQTFPFDVTEIDWRSYMETYVLGTRSYILKEDLATIPQARRNLLRMYVLWLLTQISFFLSFFWFIYKKSTLAKRTLTTLVGVMVKTLQQVKLPRLL